MIKKKCNICKQKFLEILKLGNHPCADTFLKSKSLSLKLKQYPLAVGFCRCSHMTSICAVPDYNRYEKHDYSYTSDNSPVSRSHFKNIAIKICKKFKLCNDHLVVEAGSNDGTFLKEIREFSGANVLGVDPSKNISKIAKKKKIKTIVNYFSTKTAFRILSKYGKCDVIYGANVFNHVDDNIDFLNGASLLLKKKGILILEVPDLKSLIEKVGFDTIYHEHRHYYSEKSLNKILKLKGFNIFHIEKIKYMAGSLRIFARKKKNNFRINLTSVKFKEFKNFKRKVPQVINEIKNFVKKNKKLNKNILGIGAATKGNTLLNCCQFTDEDIKFILDNSKYKINKYTPKSGIKIIEESKKINIEAALILPWNISNHLIKKLFKHKKIEYTSIAKVVKNFND